MERQDIPPLEMQFYAQLPQSMEEFLSGQRRLEDPKEKQEFVQLVARIQNGTMSAIERQQVRRNLMRLLGTSRNGMEERIMAAFHLLDRQTPPEELGECFWVDQGAERERTGP